MKKFIFGFILGSLIFGASIFAEEVLQVRPNPFPVLINGIKTDVEGYNIDGFTFLKLADFKKAGLKVVFNETDRQIEVTSVSQEVYNMPKQPIVDNTPYNSFEEMVLNDPKRASYPVMNKIKIGGKWVKNDSGKTEFELSLYELNGRQYIEHGEIGYKHSCVLKFDKDLKSTNIYIGDPETDPPLIESVPITQDKFGSRYIEYDFYLNTILPLFKKGQ